MHPVCLLKAWIIEKKLNSPKGLWIGKWVATLYYTYSRKNYKLSKKNKAWKNIHLLVSFKQYISESYPWFHFCKIKKKGKTVHVCVYTRWWTRNTSIKLLVRLITRCGRNEEKERNTSCFSFMSTYILGHYLSATRRMKKKSSNAQTNHRELPQAPTALSVRVYRF